MKASSITTPITMTRTVNSRGMRTCTVSARDTPRLGVDADGPRDDGRDAAGRVAADARVGRAAAERGAAGRAGAVRPVEDRGVAARGAVGRPGAASRSPAAGVRPPTDPERGSAGRRDGDMARLCLPECTRRAGHAGDPHPEGRWRRTPGTAKAGRAGGRRPLGS